MKLHTEIITLCDYALISREGKLSINGIFDELSIKKFPGGIARAFFVATLKGANDSMYHVTVITRDKETELNKLELNIHTSLNGKNNIILELVNLGFEMPGEYEFVILDGKEEVGKTRLVVLSVEQETVKEKKFTIN